MRAVAHRDDSRTDVGVLFALAFLVAAFELMPGTSWEPIAVRTETLEIEGIDAPVEYDVPDVEPPEEVRPDIGAVLEEEVHDLGDLILSMSSDTTGLEVVGTIETNITEQTGHGDPDVIPQPGTFVPHSVPPRCTFRPVAEYPEMARQAGVEGRVTLQVFVPVSGIPAEVVVMQSSGLDSMDSSAVASARLTRWAPAERDDGAQVGVWTALIYEFTLE